MSLGGYIYDLKLSQGDTHTHTPKVLLIVASLCQHCLASCGVDRRDPHEDSFPSSSLITLTAFESLRSNVVKYSLIVTIQA